MIMKFVWFIIGVVFGFCLGAYRKMIPGLWQRMFLQKADTIKKTEISLNNNIESTTCDRDSAINQFIATQDKFYGIYEALYHAAYDPINGHDEYTADWDSRINSLDHCMDLKALWDSTKDNPSSFLEFLLSCGVQRDDKTEIIADSNARYYYVDFYGDDIKIGDRYLVAQPFWHNGETILGKGIIKHIN